MRRRLLTVALTLCLILSLVPATAMAAEKEEYIQAPEVM